jgi:hypothetical protein
MYSFSSIFYKKNSVNFIKMSFVEIVGNAVQLLSDTQVLAIHKGENSLGKQIDDVELAVATENLTAVITAIASAGYVSIIAES